MGGANSRAQHGTPEWRGIDMQRGNGACPLGGVYALTGAEGGGNMTVVVTHQTRSGVDGGGGDDEQGVTLGQKHYGGRGVYPI